MIKVGVVMPTYNQARFLPRALDSYFAQSAPSKLVVVDDASSDETPQVLLADKRVRGTARHQANMGTAAAINTGVSVLCGANALMGREATPDSIYGDLDALTWISSDNTMYREWLEVLGAELERGAGVAYGGFRYLRPDAPPLYLYKPYERERLVTEENCYIGPAFLIRAGVWLRAGPHRGRINHDYDHWLRVEEVCWELGLLIVGVNRPLCDYNAHAERVTVTRAHEYDGDRWRLEARKRRGLP